MSEEQGVIDVSATLAAKSDQLNADDLQGRGDVIVQIVKAKAAASAEQPLALTLSEFRPYFPCKSMRRLLAFAYGPDAAKWAGRWISIYRDPDVRFGGLNVGGIRIRAMSHIPTAGLSVPLTVKQGTKALYKVTYLKPPADVEEVPVVTLQRYAADAAANRGWTADQIKALLGGKAADTAPDKRAEMVERLKGAPPVADKTSDPMPPDNIATSTDRLAKDLHDKGADPFVAVGLTREAVAEWYKATKDKPLPTDPRMLELVVAGLAPGSVGRENFDSSPFAAPK